VPIAIAALVASRSNAVAMRSAFQRPTCRMPIVSSTVTSVIVRPTLSRRGAHASRGRANRLSAIGVAISTPSRSPTYQVPQLNGSAPSTARPRSHSASVASDALTRHDATAQARKRAMSAGSESVSGCCTWRRTSDAPTQACSVAPRAKVSGSVHPSSVFGMPCTLSTVADSSEANAMPGSMRGPYISMQASAMPAAGNSGEA